MFNTYLDNLVPAYDAEEIVNAVSSDHSKLYSLEIWGKTGQPIANHHISREYSPGDLNFDIWPLKKTPNFNISR